VFYINVPIGLAAIVGALAWLPESTDPTAGRRFDIPGSLLVSAGMFSFVFGLIEGSRYGWWTTIRTWQVLGLSWNWSPSPAPTGIIVGALLLVWFWRFERRRRVAGLPVVFDIGLFRIKSFTLGNLASVIVGLGEFGLIFVLPLFLQSVLGFTAFRTGLLLMWLAGGSFLASAASEIARVVGPKRVVVVGFALEAIGIGWATTVLSPTVTGGVLGPALFVYGLGVGLNSAQLTNLILGEIPPEDSGEASGMRSAMRQVGSALGIAVLGTVLASSLASTTSARLASVQSLPPQARAGIVQAIDQSAGQALAEIRTRPGSEQVVAAVSDAITTSTKRAGYTGLVFVIVGLGFSFLIPDIRPGSEAKPETAGAV